MRSLCVALVLVAFSSGVSAAVIVVPNDYPTIQGAINAAVDGDEIKILTGVYTEWGIDTQGKKILIVGTMDTDGNLLVAVKGDFQDSVFICNSGESSETVIAQLVITNGWGRDRDDHGVRLGGGALIDNGSKPLFVNCRFVSNWADKGGGLYVDGESGPRLVNCSIDNCLAITGGGIATGSGIVQLDDCFVANNWVTEEGGGIYLGSAGSYLSETCICDNGPDQVAGATYVDEGGNSIEEVCLDSDGDGTLDCLDPCPTWDGTCLEGVPTIQVDEGESIQAAIDAIPTGGQVLLAAATFEEGGISTGGKAFSLVGSTNADGEPATTLFEHSVSVANTLEITQGETAATRIENLVIRPAEDRAMLVSGASPTILNCEFLAGESLVEDGSSPRFTNCGFILAEFHVDHASARLEYCWLHQSTRHLYTSSQVELFHCEVYDSGTDITCGINGDYPLYGGAILAIDSSLRVINSTFSWCGSWYAGGAIKARLGTYLLVSGSTFTNNQGSHGGAIGIVQQSHATIINSHFENNCAHIHGAWYGEGGALGLLSESTVDVIGCTIVDNHAAYGVSGGDYWSRDGGAIALCSNGCSNGQSSSAWIHGTVICDNNNAYPNDQILGSYEVSAPNCITDNCVDAELDTDGDGVPDCIDRCPGVDDIDSDNDGIPDCVDQCPGELDLDDDHDGVANCVDLCPGFDDTQDSDGDGIPDGCEPPCPGDLDGDGTVGVSDLLTLIDQWGAQGGDCDGDGDTDIEDLLLLVGAWGGCP